jgi:hypothetical protein
MSYPPEPHFWVGLPLAGSPFCAGMKMIFTMRSWFTQPWIELCKPDQVKKGETAEAVVVAASPAAVAARETKRIRVRLPMRRKFSLCS